jgi:hypothetical protein
VEKLRQDNQRNAAAKEDKPHESDEEEEQEAKEEKHVPTSNNFDAVGTYECSCQGTL